MKAKNSDKRALRWLPRIAIALALLPFLVPAMMLSYLFGLFYYEDVSPTSMDALVGGFTAFVHTPAYTILHDEARVEPSGTLYLARLDQDHGDKMPGCDLGSAKPRHRAWILLSWLYGGMRFGSLFN